MNNGRLRNGVTSKAKGSHNGQYQDSHIADTYGNSWRFNPTKQSAKDFSTGLSWQEHRCVLYVGPVAIAILRQHSLLLMAGQQIIDEQHADIENKDDKTGPEE